MKRIWTAVVILLGIGASALGGDAPADPSSADLLRAMDAIEPWRNTTEYSDEGWRHLIDTARRLQALPEESVADLLREYQKQWIPAQRWLRTLTPYRSGQLEGSHVNRISVDRLAAAYGQFARIQMGGATAPLPEYGSQIIDPGPEPTRKAGGVFLLLRVFFDLPEHSDDPIIAGRFQFRTAPRFYGQKGNWAWPLAWKDGQPRLIAPFFLYVGRAYNAVEDYRSLLDDFPLRRFDGASSDRKPSPRQKDANVIDLMKKSGFAGYNAGLGPVVNFSSDSLDEVKALLDRGIDPNARDIADWTALMYAITSGREQTALLLLERGAHADAANSVGTTASMMAAEKPSPLQELLKKPPALDARNEHGRTALAAEPVKPSLLQELLKKKPALDARDERGRTALMFAADTRNLEAVRLFIAAGADLNVQDEAGMTAIMLALESEPIHYDYGRWQPGDVTEIVAELVVAHADVNRRDIWGTSALSMAKKVKNKTAIQLLQLNGATE